MNLNTTEKERKEIKKELAFLSKKKQKEYLEEWEKVYDNMLKGF